VSVSARGGAIRVLVADDDPAILAAVRDLLAGEPGIAVVATARDAEEAVRLVAQHRPEVAILDVRMPVRGGLWAAREIGRIAPETRVVALSVLDDRASVAGMIRAGAIGFVVKGAPIAEIIETVERAGRGLASLSGELVAGVARELDEQLERRERIEHRRRQITAEIERALAPGGLRAVFQPIVELESGRTVGYEALARFNVEPVRGPDLWFAAAEEVGLREELEVAAIRTALDRFDDVPADAYLALNLSPTAILSAQSDLVRTRLADERVVVEVTEHAPVADYDALERALAPVRAEGGRLAIDDAGAGFASLRHILRLDPDIIKLDIGLTRGIDLDRGRRSLATALIAFGAEMGTTIVAEGIETEAELEALRSLGVRYGQGYHLGRPGELPAGGGR